MGRLRSNLIIIWRHQKWIYGRQRTIASSSERLVMVHIFIYNSVCQEQTSTLNFIIKEGLFYLSAKQCGASGVQCQWWAMPGLTGCLLCQCLHTEHVFSSTSTTVCHPSCSQQILIFWKWSLVLWCEQMFLMDNFSLDQKHSGLRTLLIWRGLLQAPTSNSLQADVDLLDIIIIIIILISDIDFILFSG